MLKEYLGSEITKYTLTSGSEVTVTNNELEELIGESTLVEELEEKIVELEAEAKSLNEELKHYEREIDSLNKEILKLEQQI